MKYTLLAILLWIIAGLTGYGIYGLVTYSDRLDMVAALQAENANIKWKTESGFYLIKLSPPMTEKAVVLGLRDDGVVVWKYPNNQTLSGTVVVEGGLDEADIVTGNKELIITLH